MLTGPDGEPLNSHWRNHHGILDNCNCDSSPCCCDATAEKGAAGSGEVQARARHHPAGEAGEVKAESDGNAG